MEVFVIGIAVGVALTLLLASMRRVIGDAIDAREIARERANAVPEFASIRTRRRVR